MNGTNKLECYITLDSDGHFILLGPLVLYEENEELLIQPHEPLLLLHCAGGLNALLANIRLGRKF
jgi:hypothetical protein